MSFPMSTLLFFSTLLSGLILSISSSSWFGAWVGLELNLLSFIPIITIKMDIYFSEAALKYFLIQALASTMIIVSSCSLMLLPYLFSPLLLLALLMKLGAAPFHFWFPQVMEGLSWPQTILLMTVQKVAPMFLISYLTMNFVMIQIIIFCSILSALVGAFSGFNMMKLRKMMAFSSINHMSWMLIAISLNDLMWIVYFLFYSLTSSSVIALFYFTQAFSVSDLLSLNFTNPFFYLSLPVTLLSLGGLPPFTGFLPKWMMINIMMTNYMIIPLIFLIFSALITLYFYLRTIIAFLLLSNPTMTFNMKSLNLFYFSLFSPYIIFLNILGLLIPFPWILS